MTLKRLLHKPLTNKKLKPIIKFNSGRGAILCNKCYKIIKEDITKEEFKGHVENLFCLECATELMMKLFKKQEDDDRPKLPEKS